MIETLRRTGADWELHYCARSLGAAPLVARLAGAGAGCVNIHTSDGSSGLGRLDVAELLAAHVPGHHVYGCGPASLMNAVRAAAAHWPEKSLHFESFGAASGDFMSGREAKAFDVVVAKTGERIRMRNDLSMLEALRRAGHDVPSSCETGVCGTCVLWYRQGDIDHRDAVLSSSEKERCVVPCVSRAFSASVVIEL